jgi:hypothetical protein
MAKLIVEPAPAAEPGWIVDTPGPDEPEQPIARRPRLREAVARARYVLRNLGGGELEIRGRNGRVRGVMRLGTPGKLPSR